MTKKQKKNLRRVLISLVLFIIVFSTNLIMKNGFKEQFPQGIASIIPNSYGWILLFVLFLGIYIYIGYDVLLKAFKNIGHGNFLDENFLMSVATIGAFSLGIYNSVTGKDIEGFDEACAVLLFYQVGEWFQSYAVGKSRKNISSLMDIRPDYANLKLENGEYDIVDPSEVKKDDIILVKPGEKIPLDGVIIEGSTTLDTKALTGESLPQEVSVGGNVISGTINLTSSIVVKVEKEFYDSTVSKILDLVENASNQKSKYENFITKFARIYTPVVVLSAIILAIALGFTIGWAEGLYRALSFLVVSCPCALVISIPLSFFCGLGGASKNGVLVKGSVYLQSFNNANVFVFDKTGTLTKGNFKVVEINAEDKDEILRLAAIAEGDSNHPIAVSIKNEYKKEINEKYSLEDISGKGIKAFKDNDVILCGNHKLMEKYNISYNEVDSVGTVIYVAFNNKYIGSIVIADEIKEEAYELVSYLNSNNIKTIMLTGDNEKIASYVANKLGIKEYKSSLLPQNKVEVVDEIIKNKKPNDVVCFCGDGINDAPVLMRSDIGISMGAVGSDAAIEASDIVLMYDDLSSITIAKKIAKKTMRIVLENIIFALAVKLIILVCSACGLFGSIAMWVAVFGDVGVSVLCILNAMRANIKNKKKE